MAMFWAFLIVVALHIVFLICINLVDVPREETPQTLIEVSLITKSAPIQAKQNDNVIVEHQAVEMPEIAPQLPLPEPIKSIPKTVPKPVVKPLAPVKKETPKPKILTAEKSEIIIKKVEKTAQTPKSEKVVKPIVEKVEVKEKPRLSLESVQQQISQLGSQISQQQVSVRDKYINDFGVKMKRLGQTIYDRGSLPAGILETKIEINANGTLIDFKITRSSGSAKLDEAVENMIRSSAPYPDLPFQLLNESSTLRFTRVWEFYGD
jgi:protein TonB